MAFLFVTATFYEHCGLSVPYPLGRSYSPFPASVTFKSWLGIFERKDKWAAYANEIVMFCILFNKTTGEGLCVIDLDTVMPGLAANDFGDSIRFGANHCAEDEADLTKVNFSMELFEIYTKGFLQAAGKSFTPLEKQTLPWGAKLMTMECGMRFLADYLEGDHYFHINYEQQNLNRARTQFKLTSGMEENWDAMQKVIEKYC